MDAVVDREPYGTCDSCDGDCSIDYELGIEHCSEEIKVDNLLDEMKFEAFIAGMKNKSLEEIQNFFK
jgi:hypothetical protein